MKLTAHQRREKRQILAGQGYVFKPAPVGQCETCVFTLGCLLHPEKKRLAILVGLRSSEWCTLITNNRKGNWAYSEVFAYPKE
jgi:hypothetical protein